MGGTTPGTPAGHSQGVGVYSEHNGQPAEAFKQGNDVSYLGFRKISLTSVCHMNSTGERDATAAEAGGRLECHWDGLG